MARTVLIVDDNEDTRMLLEKLFEKRGYQVLLAQSAEKALQILTHKDVALRPDLILLDEMMEQMRGTEMLKALNLSAKKRPQRPAVIMITSYEVDPKTESVDAVYKKPINAKELFAVVDQILP